MVGPVILTICVPVQRTFLLETSSRSLTFAILLLALYPDVQRKLYEEVVNVWPKGAPTSGTVLVGTVNKLSIRSHPTLSLGLQRRFSETGTYIAALSFLILTMTVFCSDIH